jgi:hypothetical protein
LLKNNKSCWPWDNGCFGPSSSTTTAQVKKKKGARQADARAASQELSQSERGIDFKYGTGSKDEKR